MPLAVELTTSITRRTIRACFSPKSLIVELKSDDTVITIESPIGNHEATTIGKSRPERPMLTINQR